MELGDLTRTAAPISGGATAGTPHKGNKIATRCVGYCAQRRTKEWDMRPNRAAPPTKWPPWRRPGSSGPSGQPQQQWPFSATPPRRGRGQQRRPKLGRSSPNPSARIPPVERRCVRTSVPTLVRVSLTRAVRANGDLIGQTRRRKHACS